MTERARFIPVVAISLMAVGGGSLTAGPARAEENCLSAPNAQPPEGSHWHYRTDPVKRSKCWYLRTDDQAIQKQAVQGQPGRAPLELRPTQAAPAASEDRPTTASIKHNTQVSRQTGAGEVPWPDPPTPASADKVAWPDPPSPAGDVTPEAVAESAPEPLELRQTQAAPAASEDRPTTASIKHNTQVSRQTGAGEVPWPDPPTPASADKVAWPDPPSPAGDVTPEAVAENAPEEKAKQTQEVPASAANSNKNARNDAGVDRQVAAPTQTADPQSEMPVGMLLALTVGLLITGMIVRRIVRMTFPRQRAVPPDRREPVWTTIIPSERAISNVAVQHRDLAPGSLDNDRLDDEVKEALRKLLRVLDQPAV